MESFERGREKLEDLLGWVNDHGSDLDRNEAQTRLDLINRIVFECLGWAPEQCRVEKRKEGTYSDYELGVPIPFLLLEAKRESIGFELPAGFTDGDCQLSTVLVLGNDVQEAITQALSYCQSRGIGLGAICNGHQLVAFLANREDGVAPLSGRAVVFPSLEIVQQRFVEFWDFFSAPGLQSGALKRQLARGSASLPPERLSQRIQGYASFVSRNAFQVDLQELGGFLIQDIPAADELADEFLRECYEASGALAQHVRVSKEILRTRYAALEGSIEGALHPVMSKKGLSEEFRAELVARVSSSRPVILLGDVGVGKPTFIENLVRVEARDLLEKAIVLYVDFGHELALSGGLIEHVAKAFITPLHESGFDIHSSEFLEKLYASELASFDTGIYGQLKDLNQAEYLSHRIRLLEEKMLDYPNHLKRALERIVKIYRRQIVVFLDNLDQHSAELQDEAFLVAVGTAKNWPGTVFLSLRPSTFYESRSKGTLAAYQPRIFTISPPRIDRVIEKRLGFAKSKVEECGSIRSTASGSTVAPEALAKYLDILHEWVKANPKIFELVEGLSGGNVRTAIDFLVIFMGSGHVNSLKILAIVQETGRYVVSVHEFLRAIIFGNREYFDPVASPVANLFDISASDCREHFLLGLLLMQVKRLGERSQDEGFVSAHDIYSFAQELGFSASQVDFALSRAVDKRLLDYRPPGEMHPGQRFYRITSVGAYTAQTLPGMFPYIDAMIVDTPIVTLDKRQLVHNVRPIRERLQRASIFRNYLDDCWLQVQGATPAFDWPVFSNQLREDIARIESRNPL